MKKTLLLLLALIGLFGLKAQGISTSTGQLSPVPVTIAPFEITIVYSDASTTLMSTTYIDGMGVFNDTLNMNVMGVATVSFVDCDGSIYSDTVSYSTNAIGNIVYDFGTLSFCSGSTPNTSTVVGQFNNTSGAITIELSYDGGITYQAVSTDAIGYLYETSNTFTSSGTVNAFYYDCNNDTTFIVAYNISGSPTSQYYDFGTIDYCPTTSTGTLIQVNGQFSPNPGAIAYTIQGGGISVSGMTDTSGVVFMDSIVVSSTPSEVYIIFTDCNGTVVMDTAYPSVALPYPTPFDAGIIDYCPSTTPIACNAGFTVDQNVVIDSSGTIIFTDLIMITNTSTGTNLTYTWDFGDGSPTYTGVHFLHNYTSAGPYVLCLTVTSPGTPIMPACTSTYCDTLAVDSNGLLIGKTNGGFAIQMGDGSDESTGPNSINTIEKEIALNIYPNPAQDYFTVSLNAEENINGQIEIYDLTGKLVQTTGLNVSAGESKINVQLENINKGLYLLRVNTDVGFVTRKLFVK